MCESLNCGAIEPWCRNCSARSRSPWSAPYIFCFLDICIKTARLLFRHVQKVIEIVLHTHADLITKALLHYKVLPNQYCNLWTHNFSQRKRCFIHNELKQSVLPWCGLISWTSSTRLHKQEQQTSRMTPLLAKATKRSESTHDLILQTPNPQNRQQREFDLHHSE